MTELLQRAFAAIAELPEDQQDAIATRLLEELKLDLEPELQQEIEDARNAYRRGEFITLSELKAELSN